MPKIAISYRRADTDVMAGRIRDRLVLRYGEDAVFMDIDDIPFGKDFRIHIFEAVVQSDILLVIVGQRWLGASRGGAKRMDAETDPVRFEVETALSNAVPIIPVLVGSSRMPQPAQLRETLKNFAFLNAATVYTGRDFHQHMERLIRGIDQILPDQRVTSTATSGSRNQVASAAAPASASRDADADGADLEVFRDDRFCEARGREKPGDAGWGRRRRPVINVSWLDAQDYVAWLSQETGKAYRLPSEAEWEYACRAGTTSRYSFGDVITPDQANYADSGLGRTSEAGAYPANSWGVHDMHGNVWEWVEDDWHENYWGAPADGSAWKEPEASSTPRLCVLRGGSWLSLSWYCRSAYRIRIGSVPRVDFIGFRVARTLS